MKLLDYERLQYFWNKLKDVFVTKIEGNEAYAPKNHLHTISDIEEYSPNSIYGEYKSTYDVTESTTVVPINIDRYEKGVDHLDVYINGLKLIEGVDYTDNGTNITLTKPLGVIGQVHFSCIKLLETTASLESFKGVSVSSVAQTTTSTASSGENVITVTLSDGTTSTFKVYNGAQGSVDNVYTKSEVDSFLSGKANSSHTHDGYVKKSGDTMTGTLNSNINSDGTTYRVWGAVAN